MGLLGRPMPVHKSTQQRVLVGTGYRRVSEAVLRHRDTTAAGQLATSTLETRKITGIASRQLSACLQQLEFITNVTRRLRLFWVSIIVK